MKRKKALTLLEILVVIFLITLITATIGYNMRGTLDRGRAFRTEQAMAELRDLLMLSVADGSDIEKVCANPLQYLKDSELAKDPEKLVKDGWNQKFEIRLNRKKDDFVIHSEALKKYYEKTNKNRDAQAESEE